MIAVRADHRLADVVHAEELRAAIFLAAGGLTVRTLSDMLSPVCQDIPPDRNTGQRSSGAEQLFRKQQAVGSNPTAGSHKNP